MIATKLEWHKQGSRHLAFPYQIVLWGPAFQVWRRSDKQDEQQEGKKTVRYDVIAAGFQHLDDAKACAQADADAR